MIDRRFLSLLLLIPLVLTAPVPGLALDVEKAEQDAIRNCVNWRDRSEDFCTCVQERTRTSLPASSYEAMLAFAQAYKEGRRSELAEMQADEDLAAVLGPVDEAVTRAEDSCRE